MSSILSRLYARLVMVALVALLPAIAAIVYLEITERRAARARTFENNLRLARLAASQQAGAFEGARRLLLTLAQVAALRGVDRRDCEALLARVLNDHPGYFNIVVWNVDGSLACAGRGSDPDLTGGAAGRRWFVRAMATRAAVVSEYQVNGATDEPAIVVAQPVLDAAGAAAYVLAAKLGVNQLTAIAAQAELPRGATLIVFDRAGTLVARFPNGRGIGQKLADSGPLQRLAAGAPQDVTESRGLDGIPRLTVTVPVRASIDTGLYLGMGIDPDAATSEANRVFKRYLSLLAIVSLAALGAAAVAGYMFVLRPLKALTVVTGRLAAGDLSARAQLAGGMAGVSELGDAVNAMAAAVDARQRERDRAEQELRESEDRYRLLFTQNPHPMWVYDRETLEFLEVNDAAIEQYGYSRGEFLAMRITDMRPAEDVPRLTALLANRGDSLERHEGWRHRLKSGELIDVAVTSHPVTFAARSAMLATAQDVTQRTRAEAALSERTVMTSLLADVGVALNRPQELRVCLETCARAVVAHLDAVSAGIWTLNAAGDALDLVASAGAGLGDADRRVPIGESAIGRIARDGRRYFTNHVGDDPALQNHAWARREGLVAFAGCPLVVESRVVGVMAMVMAHGISDGGITGIASVAELIALGITRRHAENARRFLASIVASSQDAIYGTTLDGAIVSWNAGAERLYGYTADDVIGQQVSLFCPPDRLDELSDVQRRIRVGEHVFHHETVRRRKDGVNVPVSITVSPIRDANGEITGMSATERDLTDRERAERTLRESEERNRLLARALESTNEMVSVTDANDRFTFVNRAFLRAYGYTAEEIIGRPVSIVRVRQTPPEVAEAIHTQSRGDGWQGELMNCRKDGTEFPISLNTTAIRDDAGRLVGLLGVARDVTEQRSLEEQLRQSQKMEAIGQLAGGVAHDFNNLLTAILGFSGFLLESLPESDERRADVEEIRHASERAAGLTKQLLAFSRKQILMARVLHVGDVIGELTPMLRRLLGEAIDLRTTIGDRGLVKADPGQLQQVLVNLAVNAHDAMRDGGRLTIESKDAVLDDAFVRQHPAVRPGPHVMLSVSDTGHGMDEATRKRIFEPFFTTKPMGQGTGLGLATVYGIVKQSGGSIWVESEVGGGTTFTVYLPRTDEAKETPQTAGADAGAAARGTETILLVEDEDRVRELAHKVLARRGYAVHTAATPKQAIEYADAHHAPIDLVLTDVILPEMSGRTMYTRLLETHPESKVLYMSGYDDRAIVRQGVLEAGVAFLQKPFSADQMARKVREVLDAARDRDPVNAPSRS